MCHIMKCLNLLHECRWKSTSFLIVLILVIATTACVNCPFFHFADAEGTIPHERNHGLFPKETTSSSLRKTTFLYRTVNRSIPHDWMPEETTPTKLAVQRQQEHDKEGYEEEPLFSKNNGDPSLPKSGPTKSSKQIRSTLESEEYLNLISDESNASNRRKSRSVAISRIISGTISFLSSLTLMIVIFRSHTGLKSPLHRLLVGLSAADMISSIGYATSSLMIPQELSYWIWNARGNVASCSTQGFLILFGGLSGILYNWSLCFYYLAVIRYEKPDEFICQKIEPSLHGFALIVPIILCTACVALGGFGEVGYICTIKFDREWDPPHCQGYGVGEVPPGGFTIPCGRYHPENGNIPLALFASAVAIVLLSPVVFAVTITMMYRSVLKIEKKISKYGVGALRRNISKKQRTKRMTPGAADSGEASPVLEENTTAAVVAAGATGRNSIMRTSVIALLSSLRKSVSDQRSSSRSNNVRSQTRAVFYRAVGYIGAWTICYTVYTIFLIVDADKCSPQVYSVLSVVNGLLSPLQGFFNLLIFLQPKVLSIKKGANNKHEDGGALSWPRAFVMALSSRGTSNTHQQRRRRSSVGAGSGRSGEGRTGAAAGVDSIHRNAERVIMWEHKLDARNMMGRREKHAEEEKVEIETPGQLSAVALSAIPLMNSDVLPVQES